MKNILLLLLLISSLGYAQTSGTGGVGVNYGAVNKDLVFFSTTNTVPTVAPINGIDTHVLLNGTKYDWDGTQWKLSTTNVLAKPTSNTIQSTVDGVASASQVIIGTNVLGLTGSNLTSTINGVASNVLNLSSIIPATTNTLTSSGNTMTNTTDGVAGTAPIINSNANALTKAGGLVTNVNGITATTAIAAGTITDVIGFNVAGVAVNQTATSLNTDRVEYTGNNTVPTGTPLAGIDTRVLLNGDRYDWNGSAWVLQTVSNDWKVLGNAGTVQATNFVGTTDNVGLSFRTNNTIQQTITNTGNVGIGITTPLSRLHSNNSTTLASTLEATASLGRFSSNVTNTTFLDISTRRHTVGTDWSGTNMRIQRTVDTTPMGFIDFGINGVVSDFGGLGFGASNTTNMVLTNAGNLGVGTTTPTAKLEVAGQVKITGGTPGLGKVLTSDATGLATWALPATNGTVTTVTATAPLSVLTPTTTPAISIATANTTTTGALTNTDWNTFNNKIATASNGLTATGTLVELGGTLTKNTNIAGNFNLTTTGTGNVGIGTTTPTRKLEVTGDGIGFPGDTRYGVSKIWNAGIGDMFGMEQVNGSQSGSTPALRLFTSSVGNAHMAFGKYTSATAYSEFARFSQIGNFGIGTTTPTAKLEINNGTAGSGLKFTQLNANSTPVTGASPLGVDATGNVLVMPKADGVFMSVSGAAGQSVGSAFTALIMGTVVTAAGVPASNYNTATGEFTVPTTGVYEITGSLRYQDGQSAGRQFGVGVHTSNADGSWFLWHAIQGTIGGSNRTTYPYIRVASFNAGDKLRMFSYVDGATMPVGVAAMQIRFLF